MNTPFPWATFIVTALGLGLIGYHFSLRTLRILSGSACVAAAIAVTWYGLVLPARVSGSLFNAFTRGANAIAVYLFHVEPGQTGWIILAAALVIGYRELEAWTLHGHARCLDTSALAAGGAASKPDKKSGPDDEAASGQNDDAASDQNYDRLVSELKFRLPAVEVRAPAILPGGSRAGGLASIAEASGFAAGGLAGAVISFFGMLWPRPRQLRVRVWMERTPGQAGTDDVSRVTVHLDDPRTGMSIATKTLAACGVDDAASMVAGYVARHIFAGDPTAPAWCTGAADGRDLGALLLARQVRDYPESKEQVQRARQKQVEILDGVTRSPQCAGVARYELAQLHDLTDGQHVKALLMHAVNREQYPRFYRGRYRLAMSLEMIANADTCVTINKGEDAEDFGRALKILWKCGVLHGQLPEPENGKIELDDDLRQRLLGAAAKELRAIRRYLWLVSVIWYSFWRRSERAILRPYWRQSYRQDLHDGVCAALVLVAIRQQQVGSQLRPPVPYRVRTILRVAAAITGDDSALAQALGIRRLPEMLGISKWLERPRGRGRPITKTLHTRHWYRPRCTRSWQAGYNLACAYAAVLRHAEKTHANPDRLCTLTGRLVSSLEFAVCNPACEMERPADWIGHDPDFRFLHPDEEKKEYFADFEDFLRTQQRRDYPSGPPPRTVRESGQVAAVVQVGQPLFVADQLVR